MELLYLWIENYGVFHGQGLNFGGQYRFDFHQSTDINTLVIEKNPSYIEHFFDPEFELFVKNNEDEGQEYAKIRNVTAIVGENGVGKSTLLDYIKNHVVYGAGGLTQNAIIVIQDSLQKTVTVYHSSTLQMTLQKKGKFEFQFEQAQFSETIPGQFDDIRELSDVSFIFYSNIFDNKTEAQYGNLYNISTNYLAVEDVKELRQNNRLINQQSEIVTHGFSDIDRQITFIVDYHGQPLPIPLPEMVQIQPMEFRKGNHFGDYDNFVRSVLESLSLKRNEENIEKKFKYNFYRSLFLVFFYELVNLQSQEEKDLVKEVFGKLGFDTIFNANINDVQGNDILRKIRNLFKRIADVSYNGFLKEALSIVELLEFLGQVAKMKGVITEPNKMYLNIAGDQRASIKSFLKMYKKSFLVNPFLTFTWHNLSTGEKALLNTYARFYSLTDDQIFGDNMKLKDNIIILIDEGDIYLHPQWQKKFLSNLVNFLPRIYGRKEGRQRNIQIIMTSHSPFIVSDLPNSNVIFMRKLDDGKTVVVNDLDEKKQTFAANIHTLFADSFFMNEGLVGELAKTRINDLVHFLLNGSLSEIREKSDMLDRLIRYVGEPVVKNQLLTMLEQRLRLSLIDAEKRFSSIDEQIQKLQLDIEKLKEQKGNDSDR